MRRALLFIMLINSITFVTHNLAMGDDEEIHEASDLELSVLESQASEKRVATTTTQKKKRKSRCLENAGCCCKAATIGALLLSFCGVPSVLTYVGISGMNKNAASITVFSASTNITEKEGCIYIPYTSNTTLSSKKECEKSTDEQCHYIFELCEEDVSSYKESHYLASLGSRWADWTGLFSMPSLYYLGKACLEYARNEGNRHA